MHRIVYFLYATIVVLATTGINSHVDNISSGSYRSWGNSSGYSSGGGSGWSGGSSHK
ncbi:hypothetical protein [Uliginosibacterium aquaticum]|uniref:Uncharacterized protein n=1 Tax=Uliginosibacterium aquaticum TaxID=2731212 RepID=A0ABX2IH28_9RHOO|nr:hypothetical protein [Uliginosibacterium aquaticum]NSL56054.1 hypothetical protein [Uliginosibacterium aquaticum]